MSTKTSHRRTAAYSGRERRRAEAEAEAAFESRYFVTVCPDGFALGARIKRLNPHTAAVDTRGTLWDADAEFTYR